MIMVMLLFFWTFFKISLFSIGGGYNMIPLMQNEMVDHGWMTAERFTDMLAISEATPGPIAVNLATFSGYQIAGLPGAVAATAGVCMPGILLLALLGWAGTRFKLKPLGGEIIRALLPILAGLLAATIIRLSQTLLATSGFNPAAPVIFALVLFFALRGRPSPLILLAGSAAAGLLAAPLFT